MNTSFRRFVVTLVALTLIYPRSIRAGCSSCGGTTISVLLQPNANFDPGDMEFVSSIGVDHGTLQTYKVQPGVRYKVNLFAGGGGDNPPCFRIQTSAALSASCGSGLWFHDPDAYDTRWHTGEAVLNASKSVNWTSDCAGTPASATCPDDGCTKQEGCTSCACKQDGSITKVQYHKSYYTWDLVSEAITYDAGSNANDQVALFLANQGPGYTFMGFESTPTETGDGKLTVIADYEKGGQAATTVVDWPQRLLGNPSDPHFDHWTDDMEDVEEFTGATQCMCWQTASNGTDNGPPAPTFQRLEITTIVPSDSPLCDPGYGNSSGPAADDPLSSGSSDQSPGSGLQSHFSFGMGRDSSGNSVGLLTLNRQLDDSTVVKASDLMMSNGTSDSGITLTTTGLPSGIAARFSAGNLTADVKNRADGIWIRFTQGTSNVIADHYITKTWNTVIGGSRVAGTMYTSVRNGISKTWEYYGVKGASTGRTWKETRPDDMNPDGALIYDGIDTDPGQEGGPWYREVRASKVVGDQPQLQTTRHVSFEQFLHSTGYQYHPTLDVTSIPGQPDLTTTYTYYLQTAEQRTNGVVDQRMGQLKSTIHPDGSWERNDYDPVTGRLINTMRPWLSTVTDPEAATLENSVCTTYELISDDEYQPQSWTIESTQGVVTSRTWTKKWEGTDPFLHARLWSTTSGTGVDPALYFRDLATKSFDQMSKDQAPGPVPNAPGPVAGFTKFTPLESMPVTDTTMFGGDFNIEMTQRFTQNYQSWDGSITLNDASAVSVVNNRIRRQADASGKLTLYRYQQGSFDDQHNTFSWDNQGNALKCTQVQFAYDPATLNLLSQNPIVTEQWIDYQGLTRVEKTIRAQDSNPANNTELSVTTHSYDPATRERTSSIRDGVTIFSTAVNGLAHDQTDESGITTRTLYDENGAVVSTSKLGHNGHADLVTTTTEDAYNSVSSTTAGSHVRVTSLTKDGAGRTLSQTDDNGLVTSYSYDLGGRRTTQVLPGNFTRITENYIDGRLKSVSGTTVIPEYHTYAMQSDGSIVETVYSNDDGSGATRSPRWQQTMTDGIGRVVREVRPGPAGNLVTQHSYNDKGQRIRTTRTGMADTLYVYDSFGNLAAQGQDFNNNGQLDVNSSDPITTTWKAYTQVGTDWYEVTTTASFLSETSAVASAISQQTFRKLNGAQDVVKTQSSDGSMTVQTTVRQPDSKTVTVTSSSNRNTLPVTSIYDNGLLISQTSPTSSIATTYQYDDLERVYWVASPEGLNLGTQYDDTSLARSRVLRQYSWTGNTAYVTDLTNTYDPLSGRLSSTINRAGETTNYAYDSMGRLIRQWGSQTYPVAYAYNGYGELVKMGTYSTAPSWFALTDADFATANLTNWVYDSASGLLTSKSSPLDTGSGTTTVSYQYWPSGLLHLRTGARNLTTTYTFDTVGRLTDIAYSDSTPAVHHTYYRTGERKTTTDAAGTHTYTPAMVLLSTSGTNVNMPSEVVTPTLSGGFAAQATEIRDGQGRRQQWTLSLSSAGSNPPAVIDMGYTYQPDTGLLASSGFADGSASWLYHYLPTGSRIDYIDGSMQGGAQVRANRSYDTLGQLNAITYSLPQAVQPRLLGWNYQYDPQHPGRRTVSYDAAGSLPGWTYGYNTRGEVTGGQRGTGSTASLNNVPGQNWGYTYDDIGNRKTAFRGQSGDGTGGPRTISYQANSLNQYKTITRPNALEVTGVTNAANVFVSVMAGPPASDTDPSPVARPPVNGEPGGYAKWLDGLTGQWPTVTVRARSPKAAFDGTDIVFTKTGRTLVQPSTSPTYDADGNLTADGVFNYTWDGENRLIAAEMQGVPAGVPSLRLDMTYDAQGRRLTKVVTQTLTPVGGGVTTTSVLSRLHFWYDGWNLVAETDEITGNLVRRYIWGTDLSGTSQGAGGVGGLLAVQNFTTTPAKLYHTCTEANGNIMGLIDAASGQMVARFDYDPFGNLITDWCVPNLDTDAVCPIRFSTKYRDAETGLYYYGYRYYSPELGRWVSKDPIGERGGLNIFLALGNNSVTNVDPFGDSWLDGANNYYNTAKKAINLFLNDIPDNDPGKKKAQALMIHYVTGFGSEFSEDWTLFMRDRPELQRYFKKYWGKKFEELLKRGKTGDSGTISEQVGQGGSKYGEAVLDQLDSMRLTLYGSEGIDVKAKYKITCINTCGGGGVSGTIAFSDVKYVWNDHGRLKGRGDLNKSTQMRDGTEMSDQEFLDLKIGQPYPIKISWDHRGYKDNGAKLTKTCTEREPWWLNGWPGNNPTLTGSGGTAGGGR